MAQKERPRWPVFSNGRPGQVPRRSRVIGLVALDEDRAKRRFRSCCLCRQRRSQPSERPGRTTRPAKPEQVDALYRPQGWGLLQLPLTVLWGRFGWLNWEDAVIALFCRLNWAGFKGITLPGRTHTVMDRLRTNFGPASIQRWVSVCFLRVLL